MRKRVKGREIKVMKSDKGKQWTVSTIESYERQAKEHTKKDWEASWEEVVKAQKEVTDHGRALANILKIGTAVGENNAKRAFSNVNTMACDLPEADYYPKRHKKLMENGDPKTRPVCGASDTMTARTANLAGRIVEGATRIRGDR